MNKLSEKQIIQILNNWQDYLTSVKDYNVLDEAINRILELHKQDDKASHYMQSQLDQANARLFEQKEEIKKLKIENLELKIGQFPDTTETYKKLKQELEDLKNENR